MKIKMKKTYLKSIETIFYLPMSMPVMYIMSTRDLRVTSGSSGQSGSSQPSTRSSSMVSDLLCGPD